MKISIVTSFPFPDGKATANRIKVFSDELIKSPKVDYVEIFCCSKDFSNSYLVNDSLRVTNTKFNIVNKKSFFIRAFYEVILAFKLFLKTRNNKFDITIVTVPSILLLIPLFFNSKKNLIALDIRDAVWTYFNEGFFSKIVSLVIAKLFSFAARYSEIISVTNISEYEQIKLISGRSSIVVSNGISKAKLDEMKSIKFQPKSKLTQLAYIGNVGIAQEIDQLIDFSRKIPELEIKIIGDGTKLQDLKKKCSNENIENVIFMGFVPPNEIRKHMETVDIFFAQIGQPYRTAVPTKVFEYIASGRKVLLGLPKGPAREIFSKFYGVEIFELGSSKSFCESFNFLNESHFSYLDREYNISLLQNNYLRESSAKLLVRAIEAL